MTASILRHVTKPDDVDMTSVAPEDSPAYESVALMLPRAGLVILERWMNTEGGHLQRMADDTDDHPHVYEIIACPATLRHLLRESGWQSIAGAAWFALSIVGLLTFSYMNLDLLQGAYIVFAIQGGVSLHQALRRRQMVRERLADTAPEQT